MLCDTLDAPTNQLWSAWAIPMRHASDKILDEHEVWMEGLIKCKSSSLCQVRDKEKQEIAEWPCHDCYGATLRLNIVQPNVKNRSRSVMVDGSGRMCL